MIKNWKLNDQINDEEKINYIKEKYKLHDLTSKLIANKNLTEKDLDIFLNPTRNDFYDPFLLPDMDKAVNRILTAIKNKEKTLIYGDFDVDGITATTIIKKVLEAQGLHVGTYIPNRLLEGYGLNEEAIIRIANQNYKLIITVDLGITAVKETEIAKKYGIDVVITDHHEPLEEIPDAVAVVDAKRKDSQYPFNGLAGCGVSFKLAQALSQKLNLKEEEYLKYLDIAAIGTISDIVPLESENRVIAKLGLKLLNMTKNIGLKALMTSAGLAQIDSQTVSFGIAPRINAAGRLGHEEEVLELFLTSDKQRAIELAKKIEGYNRERQEIENNIFQEAVIKAEKEKKSDKAIVIAGKNWHNGVIGIVSSKITDKYYKPSILLSIDDNDARGSGRSIDCFDLHEALANCSTHLTKFGGHFMAAGLSLQTKDIETFKEEFINYANEKMPKEIVRDESIDLEISYNDISIDSVKELELLEPFGDSNEVPRFLIKNLKIMSISTLKEGKHLKIFAEYNNNYFDLIGFNMGEIVTNYKISDKIDIITTLGINTFNGVSKVQFIIKDIRKSI